MALNSFTTSIFVGSNFADLLQNCGPTEAPSVGLKTAKQHHACNVAQHMVRTTLQNSFSLTFP